MEQTAPRVIAAVISAIVSISIFIVASLVKIFWEKYFHNFKLRADHKYEQRKRIKEAISKHKVSLLNSAESLNHRLWNFSDNCKEGWHIYDDESDLNNMYYLQSFCYRFLSFFAWSRKIDLEMVYLDSTISDPEDLEFLKYLKLFPQMFCDTAMFDGKDYNNRYAKDHIFKDDFLQMVDAMITENGIITFSEFKSKKDQKEFENIIDYIGSISKDSTCLKWHVINAFHFVLMAFLTKFGYDFQQTSKSKLSKLANKTPKNEVIQNIEEILRRNHLDKAKEIKVATKVLREV